MFNACWEGSLQLMWGGKMMVNVRHFITRKSVVAFQTLMKAMLGEWTTTHERIVILGKNCFWTLLPGLTWLQMPITQLYQFVWASESTFWIFKRCWWLTGLSSLIDASQPPGRHARYFKIALKCFVSILFNSISFGTRSNSRVEPV